jgi:hypothetical protein
VPSQTVPVVPASYHGAAPGLWQVYAPLTPEVIARAQSLLHDPTFTELVEPDVTHGQVRYLRTSPEPGHTAVTAWMPRAPAEQVHPAAPVPHGTPEVTPVLTSSSSTHAAPIPAHIPEVHVSPAGVTHATIQRGSRGGDVALWQSRLGLAADGSFGPNTLAATLSFQRKHGLVADGIVGPKTWAASESVTS